MASARRRSRDSEESAGLRQARPIDVLALVA
jgi:hypothetical protein